MSEDEKKRRIEYKKNRKKWILIQVVILAVLSAMVLTTAFAYYRVNKTYYIDYTEQSNIDYSVQLEPNSFYEEEWLPKDQAYVTSLIEMVMAKFQYELDMNAEKEVEYSYSYSLDATLRITDKYTGTVIYEPITELIAPKTLTQKSGQKLVIRETVLIDYDEYNDKAIRFNEAYGLKDSASLLILTLHVNVESACDQPEATDANTYFSSLNFPLAVDTAEPTVVSSVTNGQSKVLACAGTIGKNVLLVLSIIFAILDVVGAAVLLGFIYLTRNEDINYTIKTQKIRKNYRSYIQQITNEYDTEGYQLLRLKTFAEMLSIRDTIQSPILMYENEDQTQTTFVIPANERILYVYDIQVDNYDEIYGNAPEEPEEEELEEPILVDESVDSEEIKEALSAPSFALEEIDYVKDTDEDFEDTEDKHGIEVIGVVWPEREKNNKVYRYDPNGNVLHNGDIVLVPTKDRARDREIVRKATVAHENHMVDPDTLTHPLKKIIGIVKRKVEDALSNPSDDT